MIPQPIDECLAVLSHPIGDIVVAETSVGALDVAVSPSSIIVVLNWLRVQFRLLLLFEELLVLQVWQEQTSRMKLRPRLFHFVETAAVIENVRVAT